MHAFENMFTVFAYKIILSFFPFINFFNFKVILKNNHLKKKLNLIF